MKSSTEINTCMQCELYKKELKEKDTKIKLLENNILKIKSLLSESGSLIDGYNEIMEENKNLKIENEKLKNDINLNNNNNYQFELLKQKMLRYQKENQDLKAIKQFYESQKTENLNVKDANETKIKRELSLKDKEINQLNTVICLLKLHNNDQMLSNEEIIKKYSKSKMSNHNDNNNIYDDDEMLFMENDNKLNSYNNNNEIDYKDKNNNYNNNNNYKYNANSIPNNNNIKMIDIINEKDFLSGEYQKYKQKYMVYKFKYHEFKKTTKLFLSYMKLVPPGSSLSSFLDNFNENKTLNLLGAKRLKSYTDKEELKNSDNINNIKAIRNIHMNSQLRKKSEETFKDIFRMPSLFNNTDDNEFNDYDNEEKNEKNESEEKNRNNKESAKKRRKKNEKKNLIKIREEESDSNKSENESIEEKEKKKEEKKRGRKPKKLVKKAKDENESDKEEEEKKSPKKKRSKKRESKEIKENKDNEDEKNEKEEKKKDKSETPKKDKTEENKDNKNEKEEKEKEKAKEDKEEVKEKEKEKEKAKEEHIGPIPKNIKKKLDPIEQKIQNTNNLLNLLSNTPDKINKESINSILSLQNTIQEKTSFLFEIIVPNLIKLELSRVLSLFETFIEINQDSKNIIGINILENIHLNMNSNNLLNKKNHLKITNKTNDTYQNYINKNFSQSIYIISFLIDILYRKLIDVSCVSNFLYQLLFDKNIDNKNKSSILIILSNTIKEKMNIDSNSDISNKKLFLKEEQLNKYSSTENENKFYFFLLYKNSLVSENIVNLIITIYDKNNKNENNNTYDTEIINHFNKLLDKIPNDKELKIEVPKFLEEYKSSIKFNTDIFYLEIFQALNIIVEIKEMKWIYENIFTNILWRCFQNSKKDSLKRALSIYYSSLLFYLCLKNCIKNHTNENILEQQEFSRLYAWLYSIYNTQPQFESSIGFYERLCALSWIVESPIVTMSEKVVDTIKQVINNKVKGENESLCPTDFLDKLRKLNIL